jgi:hypothetical protein
MSNNLLTDDLSAPLNGATTASIEIDTGTGNLTVDDVPPGTQVLASGALQYFEKEFSTIDIAALAGQPHNTVVAIAGVVTTLRIRQRRRASRWPG